MSQMYIKIHIIGHKIPKMSEVRLPLAKCALIDAQLDIELQ